jgi:hypothetical protein
VYSAVYDGIEADEAVREEAIYLLMGLARDKTSLALQYFSEGANYRDSENPSEDSMKLDTRWKCCLMMMMEGLRSGNWPPVVVICGQSMRALCAHTSRHLSVLHAGCGTGL